MTPAASENEGGYRRNRRLHRESHGPDHLKGHVIISAYDDVVGELVEAIHRAGADYAVSDSQIEIQSVLAAVRGTEPIILGEGLDLFLAKVPRSLEGGSLRGSGILARTGLAVLAIEADGVVDPHPRPERELRKGERILFVGTVAQRDEFKRAFK